MTREQESKDMNEQESKSVCRQRLKLSQICKPAHTTRKILANSKEGKLQETNKLTSNSKTTENKR